jgi:hypothetical protein
VNPDEQRAAIARRGGVHAALPRARTPGWDGCTTRLGCVDCPNPETRPGLPIKRTLLISACLTAVALALPAASSAQATRTWVSGVGDDMNPCSRTAPCKTFAGAFSKTATKGEINCLDSAGFGAVAITRSMTIKCPHVLGGVLSSGTNGVVVNAPNARVTLVGLDIYGAGTGLNGIRVLDARSVKIRDVELYGFTRNGIDIQPQPGTLVRVAVDDSQIHDNLGNAVLATSASTGQARVSVRESIIDDNTCGLTAAQFGADSTLNYSVRCGTNAPNGTSATAVINAFDNRIADQERSAVFSNGGGATIRISGNKITGSVLAPALQAINGGSLLTFGDNRIAGNPGGNGASTGSAGSPE